MNILTKPRELMDHMEAYNYKRFQPEYYQSNIFNGPQLGDIISSELELYTRQGKRVKLTQFKGQRLVIETGSLTCPMFIQNIKAMNQLARKFPATKFIVVYVREDHPGEKIHSHTSLEEKLALAQELKQKENEMRSILVDSVQGDFHRSFGMLPNMLYIIDENSRVVFKSNWSDPQFTESFLMGKPLALHRHGEIIEPVHPDAACLMKTCFRAGLARAWEIIKSAPVQPKSKKPASFN